jgi:hypothetical protein
MTWSSSQIARLILLLCFALNTGCQAGGIPRSSADRIIEGPFVITTQWQTIQFDKPLETIPHVQSLYLLLEHGRYDVPIDVPLSEYVVIAGSKFHSGISFRQKETGVIVIPQVVFIDQHGKEFHTACESSASYSTKLGPFKALGFGPDSRKGKLFLDKKARIAAIRIKANTQMKVEHLLWTAVDYYKNPDSSWEDIAPSEIQRFE